MAISLKAVQAVFEKLDFAVVDEIEKTIDEKMSDDAYVKAWVCNKAKNPTFRFTFMHTLNGASKAEIIRRFKAAGWGDVECTNSEENGERSGMCGVELYTNKQSEFGTDE